MKKGLIFSVVALIIFLTGFSTWQFLRQHKLSKSFHEISRLYDIANAIYQLQGMAEDMRAPMYHYLSSGMESSLTIFKRQQQDFVIALKDMEERLDFEEDFTDFFEDVKEAYDNLEKEIAGLKKKAEKYPHAASIIAGGIDAKIRMITENLNTVLDWVDMAIEDTRRNLNRLSILKPVRNTTQGASLE